MNNPERLKELKKKLRQFEGGFESQQACVTWAAETAPFLNFNNQHYRAFTNSARYINIPNLSSFTIDPHINNMKSAVVQAITELEHGLTPERRESAQALVYPEKVTLKWLKDHVAISLWLSAAGILLAVFVGGVTLGSSEFYKEKIKPFVSVFTGSPNK